MHTYPHILAIYHLTNLAKLLKTASQFYTIVVVLQVLLQQLAVLQNKIMLHLAKR
jgi:hypothetical protein